MISLDVVDTDAFLEMPVSSQLLYFHLNTRADDDGFVSSPRKIIRTIGCNEDDLKILAGKKFILVFNDGVCVIKHWRINNYIRKDIYQETKYLDLKRTLFIRKNGVYTLNDDGRAVAVPAGHFQVEKLHVDDTYTQRTLSIGKVRVGKVSKNTTAPSAAEEPTAESKLVNIALEGFKDVNPSYTRLYPNKNQRAAMERLLKIHGLEKMQAVIGYLPKSNAAKYAPTITTPIQLEERLGALLAWAQKQKDTSGKGKELIV